MFIIEWLNLNSGRLQLSSSDSTALDELSKVLEGRLKFEENERDMICLHHIFDVESDGEKEQHASSLVVYGDGPGGHSAMAKTVGLPIAIGTDLILRGIQPISPFFTTT